MQDLAQLLLTHMGAMRRCNSQSEAVAWMAQAYNLMERCLHEIERPKVFQVPGSYGEKFYTIVSPEVMDLPAPKIIMAHRASFDNKTVEYGDKFQNRAWTKKDTRRLERENARRAAEGLTGSARNRQYGRG